MKRLKTIGFIILFLSLLVGLELACPQILAVNLEKYDPVKYKIALDVSKSPHFTKGDVRFYVCFGIFIRFSGAYTIPPLHPGSVFLSPEVVRSDFFDIEIAHELGHLEYGHSITDDIEISQMEADIFAAKIVGKERLRNYRIAQGYGKDHLKNLED